jgi:AraC family transcriptional activator of pobA
MQLVTSPSSESMIEKEIKDSFSIYLWYKHVVDTSEIIRITYNRIFLIKEGSGILYIDDISYPISGNEIFLLGKGQVFSFSPYSTFTGYELCFGDCFWERTPASANNCKAVLYNNITANQHRQVQDNGLQEISSLFHILYLEYSGMDYINKLDALAAYLKIIMIKTANLNASLTRAYDSFDKQLYGQFLELITTHYQTTHDVSDYARLLNISTRKLSEICKQNSNKGPKEIINAQIITEAKRTLQFTTKPVKKIAFELNFTSPEQFSHFFKKYTQLSPQLYRASFVKIGM